MWRLKSRKKAADTAKKARNGRGKKPRPFQFEALEPRLLLSADMIIPSTTSRGSRHPSPVIEEAAPAEVETVQAGDNLDPTAVTETAVPGQARPRSRSNRNDGCHGHGRVLRNAFRRHGRFLSGRGPGRPGQPLRTHHRRSIRSRCPVPHRCLLEDSGKDWSVVTVVDGLQKENAAATAAANRVAPALPIPAQPIHPAYLSTTSTPARTASGR